MNYQNKIKLSKKDKNKKYAFFLKKIEEYKLKTLEELKDIFQTKKLSSTEKDAIIVATNHLMQQQMDETMKLKMIEDNIEGE